MKRLRLLQSQREREMSIEQMSTLVRNGTYVYGEGGGGGGVVSNTPTREQSISGKNRVCT